MKKILIPLPSYGFDPTEVAIPWRLLSNAGIEVVFCTPNGVKASPDIRMLEGRNLGVWAPVLKARQDAVDACLAMQVCDSFSEPLSYEDACEKSCDGLILPGGHDQGVKEYLESHVLQKLIVDFFSVNKPVGAICHGVVLAARSINPETKQSVIHEYQTTALLSSQELLAYNLTRWWLGDYYRTYPGLTVEDEVRSALVKQENFLIGPRPILRDSKAKLKRGYVVKDRNYLSARWPGDAYNFSLEFMAMLNC